MHIIANVHNHKFQIECGEGHQHIRWLGLVIALRFQREVYPHSFRIPAEIRGISEAGIQVPLRPRMSINEELKNGDEVHVELRDGAHLSAELGGPGSGADGDNISALTGVGTDSDELSWLDEAYGAMSNLRLCKFQWKVSTGGTGVLGASSEMGIPAKVRGEYTVHPTWKSVYNQTIIQNNNGEQITQIGFSGKFEANLEPIETGDGGLEWIAILRRPPGSAVYQFVLDDGSETICPALDKKTLTPDGSHHFEEFPLDVRIAGASVATKVDIEGMQMQAQTGTGITAAQFERLLQQAGSNGSVLVGGDPYPDIDSRPSTASSGVEGAEQDPRFEADWSSLALRWISSEMRLRVRDVLREFYGILVDLCDSYAFMGVDLGVSDASAQSAQTIGLDDLYHLMLQASLVSKGTFMPQQAPSNGLSYMPIPFVELIRWYEDSTQVRDGRPYLNQRLGRAHFLELILRCAWWSFCEHPSSSKQTQSLQMPLDEALFRFLTDVLIPIMDAYDSDPIRKDAVIHENLVAIQRARPNLRSIYTFLSQKTDEYGEHLLEEGTVKFVLEFAQALLQDMGEEDQYVHVFLQEVDKLGEEHLGTMLSMVEDAIQEITHCHLECDSKKLLFWEFFELVMHFSRAIFDSKAADTKTNQGMHVVISQVVNTLSATVKVIDARGVALPGEGEGE